MSFKEYKTKLLIYWALLVISLAVHPFITQILAVIAMIWMVWETDKEAKVIGVNKFWWVAVFFLGPVGATIYYFMTNKERAGKN